MQFSLQKEPKSDRGGSDVSSAKQEKMDTTESHSSRSNKPSSPPSAAALLDHEREGQSPSSSHSELPHQQSRQREHEKDRTGRKLPPDQQQRQHNISYPPQQYPYPSYPPYYGGYPPVPPGGHGHYPPMHHGGPAPPPPPHGGYPPQHQRSGYGPPPPHPGRGTKRSHTDREESGFGGRHEYHAHWGAAPGYEEVQRPKRKWSGEERERERERQVEERPRILIKHDEKRAGRAGSPEKKPESPSLEGVEKSSVGSFHRTLSSSSDPPGSASETPKHRVTFADDVMETGGDKEEANIQAPQGSSRRAPLQKIMLRKMGGEKDGDPTAEKGKEPSGPGGSGRGGPKTGDHDMTAAESAKPKTAWSSNERGPIISQKTLYEPEGKQSVAKFKKYQAQSRETSGSRGSHDLATPTSDGGTTPTGDRPDGGGNKRDETSSPIDRAGQSSPSGKERRPADYRKGGRKGEREKPPLQDRDLHDHHNRPHHRKENSRRERGGEGEHGDGPPPPPPPAGARTTRPAATERLASTEDEEGGREEHDHHHHHHHEPRGKGHPPSRREPPHHQDRPPLLGTA